MAKARAKAKLEASLAEHEESLAAACQALPPIVLVHGPEAYLRRSAVESLLAAYRRAHPGLGEAVLHGPGSASESGLPVASLLDELQTGSLFAAEKIVILRQAAFVLFPVRKGDEEEGRNAKARPEDALAAWLRKPAAGIRLLLESESLQRQRVLGKALVETAALIPCPEVRKQAEVAAWLRAEAQKISRQLEPGFADALFTAHGGDLGALRGELEKLALFAGTRSRLTVEDAKAFWTGTVEFEVFGLTNAIEARDRAEALAFARRITAQGLRDAGGKKTDADGSSHRALHMLATTFEGLLAARAGLAAELHLSPWRAEKLAAAAQRYTIPELRAALGALAEILRAAHDTAADPCLALERAIIACCPEPRRGG